MVTLERMYATWLYVTAKQRQDNLSALLSALTLQFNSYYFHGFKCSPTIFLPKSIWNKTVLKSDLCLMISNNRSQYYARYWQIYAAKYSDAVRTYWESNRDEIKAYQRNSRLRNLELSRLQHKNEYLEDTSSGDTAFVSIGPFHEDYINCVALSLLSEHGKTEYSWCFKVQQKRMKIIKIHISIY